MRDPKSLLKEIREGMKAYDNTGNEIGTVDFVHFSEMGETPSTGAASLPDESAREQPVGIIAKLFGSDDLPEELRERLLMHGFIRIDSAGLFGADRYVISDQIASVGGNGVHLKVPDEEELIKG